MTLRAKASSAYHRLGKTMKRLSYANIRLNRQQQARYHEIQSEIMARSGHEQTKVAVVIHLYYPEAWEKIVSRLNKITEFSFDVFVSLPRSEAGFRNRIIKDFPDAYVYEVPNRGRDVLPFLGIASSLEEKGYKYVLKIHSKKSTHRTDGNDWFNELIDNLIPENKTLQHQIVTTLSEQKTAIIGPASNYTSLNVNFDANGAHMTDVVKKLYSRRVAYEVLQRNRGNYGFFAGTMTWIKLESIMPLFRYANVWYFEKEVSQIDATFAHAVERLLSIVPEISAQNIYEVDGRGIRKVGYDQGVVPDWSSVYIGPRSNG